MAINKKLIYFKKKENFDSEVANGNILDNSIVFIQDSKEISTHGTLYKTVNWSVLEGPELITFTIESTSYQAEEGMTWEEWISSESNTGGYNIDSSGLIFRTTSLCLVYEDGSFVNKNDIIIPNYIYSSTSYEADDEPICCFIAGSKVTMSDYSIKNIEDVVIGDKVLSYNIETKMPYETEVKNVFINSRSIKMARITTEYGNSVTFTDYHPLLTTNGWRSITNYNNYETLVSGDELVTISGIDKIVKIEQWNEPVPISTYTLNVVDYNENPDVDTNDNYYINGFIGHNANLGQPCVT